MNVGGGGGKGKDLEFELNLAPIIDCFTVLITFMLASASFLSVAVMDVNVPSIQPATDSTPPAGPPEAQISLSLLQSAEMQIKITGAQERSIAIPPAGSDENLLLLVQNLKALKTEFPKVKQLTVSADKTVEYQRLVSVMDQVRETFPQVTLGGF